MFADIDHAHPDARKECIEWGVWVLKEAGFDGFRFDAIKHIDEGFIADFVQQVRERVDNVSSDPFLLSPVRVLIDCRTVARSPISSALESSGRTRWMT